MSSVMETESRADSSFADSSSFLSLDFGRNTLIRFGIVELTMCLFRASLNDRVAHDDQRGSRCYRTIR